MKQSLLLLGGLLFAALPSTSTYQLNSYGFGSGGGVGSTGTYSLEGTTGEPSTGSTSTITYKVGSGFVGIEQAQVPQISAFNNNSGEYYNKLHFVIDTQSNPTDATYALSISTDNFVSDIRYIQTDMTIGTTLTSSNFQTYAAWGGGAGANIIGLAYGQSYQLRAAASRGKFTQVQFGPYASATTASPSITFNLITSTQATPPFSVNFGTFVADTVTTTAETISLGLTTNAASGGNIYVTSKYAGLRSVSRSTTLNSATADLTAVSTGYGAQSTNATQGSGGPLTALSPYDGTSNSVGIVDTVTRGMYTTVGPITSGAGTVVLKAKTTTSTVAATDYTDVLTFVAAGNF